MKEKKLFKIIGISFAVIFTIFFILSIIYQENLESILTGDFGNYGLAAIAIIVFLLELIPQYISPQIIIINAGILGFKIESVILMSIIGTFLASLLGFHLGRYYGVRTIKKIYGEEKVSNMEYKVNKYGRAIIFIAALIPVPYIPIIFGSLNLSWKNFIIFGLITRIVGFAILGFGISLF